MDTVPSRRESRSPRCARCRNHGLVVALKGHAGRCAFSRCSCWKCSLITERTRIMARQRGIRKRQRAEGDERGAGESGNRTGASSEGHAEAYTELQAPEPAASGAWAPDTDPEIKQKSSDQRKGTQDSSVYIEKPHLPWEYFVTELPQNAGYPGDLAMGMPLHARYASAYARPAFLVGYGVPPLGAIGFPHIPQTALMESTQEGPGFFYMPYLLQQKPDHRQQYSGERAGGDDVPPGQHGRHSGGPEGSQRQAADGAFP